MYRALALKAIEWDVSFDDEPALVKLAHNTRIVLEPGMSGNRVMLDHRDVSLRVREPDVTEAASRVSVHPGVRQWMVARQKEMGAGWRRSHGRPRHRHQGLSRCRCENLSRRRPRWSANSGACNSKMFKEPRPTPSSRSCASAIAAIAPGRRPRWSRPAMPCCLIPRKCQKTKCCGAWKKLCIASSSSEILPTSGGTGLLVRRNGGTIAPMHEPLLPLWDWG